MSGRNLTPDEVEAVLDVLENMIAWTARVRQPTEQEQLIFIDIRDEAHKVWSESVRTIDGNNNA